jgi:hypothetical protein
VDFESPIFVAHAASILVLWTLSPPFCCPSGVPHRLSSDAFEFPIFVPREASPIALSAIFLADFESPLFCRPRGIPHRPRGDTFVVDFESPIFVATGSHPSWSSLLHLGFFLVHSYERVGLYQFSTVNHCRLAHAQKYCYAKVTTKIAIVPLAFLLIFSVKPNQKPWALSTTASAAAGGPPAPVQAQCA